MIRVLLCALACGLLLWKKFWNKRWYVAWNLAIKHQPGTIKNSKEKGWYGLTELKPKFLWRVVLNISQFRNNWFVDRLIFSISQFYWECTSTIRVRSILHWEEYLTKRVFPVIEHKWMRYGICIASLGIVMSFREWSSRWCSDPLH